MRIFNGYLERPASGARRQSVGVLTTVSSRSGRRSPSARPPLMAVTASRSRTAGAAIFHKKGNAVDAACAMIAATSTMWDTLGWEARPRRSSTTRRRRR